MEWKEPDAPDSASCVALGKSFTSWSLSFPVCLGAVKSGWGPRPDDGSHDWPREGKCPLKVSQRRRMGLGSGPPDLRACGRTSSTDPENLGLRCEPRALETQGGGSLRPEGPNPLKPESNPLPCPPWPVPREGAKIHQLRHQLAGGSEKDKSTSCPETPYRGARPGGKEERTGGRADGGGRQSP